MAVKAQWCVSISFRDAKGQTRKITVCYAEDLASAALNSSDFMFSLHNVVVALQACTRAHVYCESDTVGGGTYQDGLIYGTTGDYQSVSQQAHLYYITQDPSGDPSPVASITIPAPIASGLDSGYGIFLADRVTVNPTETVIVALNTALNVAGDPTVKGVACARAGSLYETFVGGIFLGKKLTRRFNRYTKDPTLSIAGI